MFSLFILSMCSMNPETAVTCSRGHFNNVVFAVKLLLLYRRTSFNCENLIASFSRVCKLLIRKLILLIAHLYVQFAQMQLFKFAM